MIAWFISHLQSRKPALSAVTIDNYVSGLRYCLMQLSFDAAVFKALRFQEIPYLPLLEHKSYIYLYKEYAAENQRFSVQRTFSSSFGSQYKLETNGAYQRSQ
jgi:hypothetical protein